MRRIRVHRYLFLAAMMAVLQASSASANDGRRVLEFFGHLQAELARQAAMQAAQLAAIQGARQAWASLDPPLYQCLLTALSPPPPVLAEDGISPSDPRLSASIQSCSALVAQQTAQRRQAAMAAAEAARRAEQMERERAESAREAAAEQARLQAEQERRDADEKQRLEVQQTEERLRQAEEQRIAKVRHAMYAQLQVMPELKPWIGEPASALVFLRNTHSRQIIRDLNGKIKSVGTNQPTFAGRCLQPERPVEISSCSL